MPYQVVTSANVVRTLNVNVLGIQLSGANNDVAIFEPVYTSIEQEFAKLKTLLLTRLGERVMEPTFGTNLLQIIFQPNTENIKGDIKDYILEPVNQWLPDIEITDIVVTTADDDPTLTHNVEVRITFRPTYGEGESKTLTLGANQNGSLTITP